MHRYDPETAGLPRAEFAFPGPLRDRLVAAVLAGTKTATAGLLVEYEQQGEAVPAVGDRSVVVDSEDQPVAVIETIEVRIVRAGDVDLQFALDEGEGFRSVAEWRAAHERFWHSNEYRATLRGMEFAVSDETAVVADRFQLVKRL